MKLIDAIEIIGGGTPKTSCAEYWNGNIPWLSVKDFNNDNRYVYSTEKTITPAGLEHSSTKLLQKDDIIISARGTVGEMAMISFPMAFNQSCGKTPPRKEKEWFSTDNSDMKWISISDMGNCGMYINNSSEYLTQQAIEKFNIKIVPKNTVLLSFKLTVGRVAITNDNMTTNEAIAHFKTDKEYIIEYLYFYLKNFNFQSLGSTSSIATAVNSKIIKSMPFVVPTINEITRFNEIASSLFAEIKKNQEENQRLSALRDALLPKLMNGEIDVSEVKI